jgi:hypothetical protein
VRRELRRARDINFSSRGVMLLGAAYPVLAVHDGDDWRRKLEPSVGDFVFNESRGLRSNGGDGGGVEVFTSGTERHDRKKAPAKHFRRWRYAILRSSLTRFAQRTHGSTRNQHQVGLSRRA